MRPWPPTLMWRTVALLAVLLVLSQVAAVAVLQLSLEQPRMQRVVAQVASVVNLTRAALVSSRPSRREALLEELSRRESIRIHPDSERRPPRGARQGPAMQRLQQALARRLGRATRVVADLRRDALWVSFAIGEHGYWLVLPRARIEQRPFPWRIVGWIAVSMVIAVLGAWLIVHRVGRPLEQLSQAAGRLGRGESPPPVPERGPRELRTLARSFNAMVSALDRVEADRKLLLAGVSHDLRTPLARLRLQAEMLEGEGAEEAREGLVRDIEDMDAIIGQFLDFVREGTGEAAEPVELDAVVQETVLRYARLGHPVEARTGGLEVVPLRPTALRRMLANLIDNALAHGQGKGDAPVEVSTWSQAGQAYLSVLDRGPGIPPEAAERLMQPFTRLDPDRAGEGGSGLGLAIAARIARSHGSELELLMRPGGGLEARMALPSSGSVRRD